MVRGHCAFCGEARLDASTYCLGCDRSGRELQIPGSYEPEKRSTVKFKPRGKG